MGIFGWSYPPGVTGNEPEICGYEGPCDVCGYMVDACICPECPECGAAGDQTCYEKHGLVRSPEQVENRAKVDEQMIADAQAEAEYWERMQEEHDAPNSEVTGAKQA